MNRAIDDSWTPIFRADWLNPVFIHFRVEPQRLQPCVPFELDTFGGDAFVSLVAFTQSRLRPAWGGRIAEMLAGPLASHEFLNLRTYVRHGDQRGIYFIAEWIPNRLAALIGPGLYGLPYRLGRLRYRFDPASGELNGTVASRGGTFHYCCNVDSAGDWGVAVPGSLDHFLLERYAAFTARRTIRRMFRVEHDPWLIKPLHLDLLEVSLIQSVLPRLSGEPPILAHFSPGVRDVALGGPVRLGRLHLEQEAT